MSTPEHVEGGAPAPPEAPVAEASNGERPQAPPPEAPEASTAEAPAPEAAAPGQPGQPEGGAPPEPAPENEEHEQLQRDLEELTAKASKADEYLELAQRTKADFENYRKRAAREAAAAQDRGVARLAKELLPAVDNLDRALEAAQSTAGEDAAEGTLASGIKLVHADVIAALARAGIERYSPEGEVFDPQHHEAVAQQPVDGAQPGTIVEVYQRGYRLGDAVIRPARVLVAG
jgi:molecular chaperone GrpE